MKDWIQRVALGAVLTVFPSSAQKNEDDFVPDSQEVAPEPKEKKVEEKVQVVEEKEPPLLYLSPENIREITREMWGNREAPSFDLNLPEEAVDWKVVDGEKDKIDFSEEKKGNILCNVLNNNDDHWFPNEEQQMQEAARDYIDGGWTNGFGFDCGTALGAQDSKWSFGLTHDMFTGHTETKDWQELVGERPAGGEFAIKVGNKLDLYDENGISFTQYVQGSLGYQETSVTEDIQQFVHDLAEYPYRDYDTNPLESGVVGDVSYGFELNFESQLLGSSNLKTGVFTGATVGDYDGTVIGGRIQFGSGEEIVNTGIPFKTDTNPLFYTGKGLGEEGDWSVNIEFGQQQIDSDSRFGDFGFEKNVDFMRLIFIRQIDEDTYIFSGSGVQENTSEIGPSTVPNITIGIGRRLGGDDKGSGDKER